MTMTPIRRQIEPSYAALGDSLGSQVTVSPASSTAEASCH